MNTSDTKANIIKNVAIYVPSRYFSQFLGFFTSLIMKRFLGPLYAGIWDLLKLIMQYVDYSELGSTLAIYYKVPFFSGQGKTEEVKKVQNVVLSFILCSSAIAGAGMVLYALVFSHKLDPEIYLGLIACSVIIVLERIYSFYVMLTRAYKDYKALSKSVFLDAILTFLLALFIVSKFRLHGLFIGVAVVTFLNLLYIYKNTRYSLGFDFDLKALISQIKFGFPVYLASIMTMLLNSIDRVMIAWFLGFQQLGFYSIALMSKSYSSQLSTNFSHVTSPYFMEDAGRYGDSDRVHAYIIKGTFSFSCFMSIILGLIFIYSTPVIKSVLPAFMPGLTALKIFLLTSFFSSLVSFPTNYIVVKEKQGRMVLFAAIALAANVLLNYAFIKAGFGINGVAAATTAASFIYLLTVLAYSIKYLSRSSNSLWKIVKIFLPAVYVLIVVLVLDIKIAHSNSWIAAFMKSAVFLVLSAAIVMPLEKETGLVGIFVGLVKKRFLRNGKHDR